MSGLKTVTGLVEEAVWQIRFSLVGLHPPFRLLCFTARERAMAPLDHRYSRRDPMVHNGKMEVECLMGRLGQASPPMKSPRHEK